MMAWYSRARSSFNASINSATAAAPALPFFFFVIVSALFIFHKIGCGDWGVGLSSTPDRAPTWMINFAQTTALVEVSVVHSSPGQCAGQQSPLGQRPPTESSR